MAKVSQPQDSTGSVSENAPSAKSGRTPTAPWTFLTNHAHVLLHIAGNPDARMRDMAVEVGITERAVLRIVAELEAAGYLDRERDGRRNRYHVRGDQLLRHPIERHVSVADLIELVLAGG
ncbi:MAG: hypothetical protein ACI8TX_000480 [Hyphomicrobiaceae bacterium]|jgi:hypothetical protein